MKRVTVLAHQVLNKLCKAMGLDQGDEFDCSLISTIVKVKIKVTRDQQVTWVWSKILQVGGEPSEKGRWGGLVLT